MRPTILFLDTWKVKMEDLRGWTNAPWLPHLHLPRPMWYIYFLLKAYFSDGLRPEKGQRLLAFTYRCLWPERKWRKNPGTFSLTAFAYFSQDTRAPSYTPSLRTCLQTTLVGDDITLHCVRLTSGSSQTASEGTSETISVFVTLEKSLDDGLGKWWILRMCAVRRVLWNSNS